VITGKQYKIPFTFVYLVYLTPAPSGRIIQGEPSPNKIFKVFSNVPFGEGAGG
jgi:hypothetical protein